MNKKNTLVLLLLFILISAGGSIYSFMIQKGAINDKEKRMNELNETNYDPEALSEQLSDLESRAAKLDSTLVSRDFLIPENLPQSRFFDFVNDISSHFALHSYVDILYNELKEEAHFNYYEYTVRGTATYNNLFELVYGIEVSKDLKKITSINLKDFVKVDDDGYAHYLVNFTLDVSVYFAESNRFTTADVKEKDLHPDKLYNVFYPLIRQEIPPNEDELLDVQTATLLALVPEGAFLSDGSGKTYLITEGDKVYLGYCTEVNYISNEAAFILNKGGLIDRVRLKLGEKNETEE